MKALTICQPYAELIRLGQKRVENRTWPTNYRGVLLIHAGKSRDWWTDGDDDRRYPNAAWGAVIATAALVDCVKLDNSKAHRDYPWLAAHDHANGPWCWILDNVASIGPWPWRGAQGLFDIDYAELIAPRAATH
jgi:hypothetical protein